MSFFTPGEGIFSTSIAVFNKEYGVDYDTDSGTSFSAPMIAGIIALGYNQFGYVPPDMVYESLNESLRMNDASSYVVDAARYLDSLNKKYNLIQEEQRSFKITGKNGSQSPLKTNTPSNLSDGDYLAAQGYIEKKDKNTYNLSERLPRQEVVALAMKLSNVYIPTSYTCRGVFWDVSSRRPNSWACRVIENALDYGIITKDGGNYFKPEDSLTLVEAVSMLLRASNIKIQQYSGGEFEPWQTNVIGTTFSLGLVENKFDFSTTRIATRKDIFAITRNILELRK